MQNIYNTPLKKKKREKRKDRMGGNEKQTCKLLKIALEK